MSRLLIYLIHVRNTIVHVITGITIMIIVCMSARITSLLTMHVFIHNEKTRTVEIQEVNNYYILKLILFKHVYMNWITQQPRIIQGLST